MPSGALLLPILPEEHLWEADGRANPKYISWVHVEMLPSCWFFGIMPYGIHGWWETQMLPENSWRGNSPSVSGGPGKAAAAAAAGFVGRCPTGTLAGNALWTELLLSCLNHPFLQLHFNGLHGHCLSFSHWMVRGHFWLDMAWQKKEMCLHEAGRCCFCLQTLCPGTLRDSSNRHLC